MVMRVAALLCSVPQTESRKEVNYAHDKHSVLKIKAENEGPAYEVVAILDPTTRAAQKYTPLIMVCIWITQLTTKFVFAIFVLHGLNKNLPNKQLVIGVV